MSAQNLSVELFRGVMTNKIKQPLGIHWSSEKSGAGLFANPSEGEKHTIVHGKVNRSDIATGYDKKFMEKHQILDSGAPEYEEPVYPGSKVKVTGVTRIRNTGGKKKTRSINYNPPKEMQA